MDFKGCMLFMVSICVKLSHQQCPEFVEVEPENYDREYRSITEGDSGARPLGFIKSTLVYQGEEPAPCFRVSGVTGQQVEIKFETVPSMRLCLKGKTTNDEWCAEGRLSNCITLTDDVLDLEFFCDIARGCAEGDVNFWLRITKGLPPAEDTEGMWCHNLQEEYPQSLRRLPINFTAKPEKAPTDGATVVTPSLSAMAVFLSLYRYFL